MNSGATRMPSTSSGTESRASPTRASSTTRSAYYSARGSVYQRRRPRSAAPPDLMPARARVRYNEALALQRLGRRADAEAAFVKAQNTDPEDPDVAYALAVLYGQQNEWSRARDAAARLAALSPGNPQVQELIDRIRRRSP